MKSSLTPSERSTTQLRCSPRSSKSRSGPSHLQVTHAGGPPARSAMAPHSTAAPHSTSCAMPGRGYQYCCSWHTGRTRCSGCSHFKQNPHKLHGDVQQWGDGHSSAPKHTPQAAGRGTVTPGCCCGMRMRQLHSVNRQIRLDLEWTP